MASATHGAKAKLAAARAVAQNLPVPMTAGCCAEHAKVGLGWRYGSLNVWSVCRRSSLSHTKGVGGRKAHATILVPQPALHPGRPLDAVSTTAQARSDEGLTAGRADLADFFADNAQQGHSRRWWRPQANWCTHRRPFCAAAHSNARPTQGRGLARFRPLWVLHSTDTPCVDGTSSGARRPVGGRHAIGAVHHSLFSA